MAKKQAIPDVNEFLNSLTDDEFTEFVQARDMPIDKLQDTGREKETFKLDMAKEQAIDYRE
jgi:hypothetical protein